MTNVTGASIDRLAMLRQQIDGPPFHHWLKPVAMEVDEESQSVVVTLGFRPELGHTDGAPIFHGGVIAALADITGHATVAVWRGTVTPTITLTVDYLASATGDTLVARGSLRKIGRSLGRADIELRAGDRIVALARGTFSTGNVG